MIRRRRIMLLQLQLQLLPQLQLQLLPIRLPPIRLNPTRPQTKIAIYLPILIPIILQLEFTLNLKELKVMRVLPSITRDFSVHILMPVKKTKHQLQIIAPLLQLRIMAAEQNQPEKILQIHLTPVLPTMKKKKPSLVLLKIT